MCLSRTTPTTHPFTLASVTGPDNNSISFEYDIWGNVTKVTDQRGKQTKYAYDYMGRLKSETDPLNRTRSVTYNDSVSAGCSCSGSVGRVASYTTKAGDTDTYDYDDAGRLTKVTFAGSTDKLTIAYDANGRMTSCTDTRIPVSFDFGNSQTFTYTRDARGRVTSVTYPDGQQIACGYGSATDAIGRVTTMTLPGIVSTGYNYSGRWSTQKLGKTSIVGLLKNPPAANSARYQYGVIYRVAIRSARRTEISKSNSCPPRFCRTCDGFFNSPTLPENPPFLGACCQQFITRAELKKYPERTFDESEQDSPCPIVGQILSWLQRSAVFPGF